MTAVSVGQKGTRPRGAEEIRDRVALLHADDFGMSQAVNRGVLRGFEEGLLTSTSILANAPGTASALESWPNLELRRQCNQLPSTDLRRRLGDPQCPFDLGVHLNLTQGSPLTADRFPEQLLDAEGRFPGAWGLFRRLLRHGQRCHQAVRNELSAQIARVIDHGIQPTHLNGHQYLEMFPTMCGHFFALMEQYGIARMRIPWELGLTRTVLWHQYRPAAWFLAQIKRVFASRLRNSALRLGKPCSVCFCGTATAGRVDLAILRQFLAGRAAGVIEVGLHPGEPSPEPDDRLVATGWFDALRALRPRELELCTSRRAAAALAAAGYRLGRLAETKAEGNSRQAA